MLRQVKIGTIKMKASGGLQLSLKRVSTPSKEIAELLRTLDITLPKSTIGKMRLSSGKKPSFAVTTTKPNSIEERGKN